MSQMNLYEEKQPTVTSFSYEKNIEDTLSMCFDGNS
jgi:hypothetical protein